MGDRVSNSAWCTRITIASLAVHTHARRVRLPEVNAGSEALRTPLGTPQSTCSQRRETQSQAAYTLLRYSKTGR